MPITQKKTSFLLALYSKEFSYSGPYMRDIVKCHVWNFLLNNIITQTTFEGREKAEKIKTYLLHAYCVLGW